MFSFQPTTNRRYTRYDYGDESDYGDDGVNGDDGDYANVGYNVVGERRAAFGATRPRPTTSEMIPWSDRLPPAPPTVDGYFWRGAPLDDQQKKYCRCLLHVAARNKAGCYDTPDALGTGRCYNPYAVCTASVGRQSACSEFYAPTPQAVRDGIPDDEVEAFARMRRLPVGQSREATVATIEDYLRSRGKYGPMNWQTATL
ncbi:hypothetical protein psal_cds_254 [Pandoravirus salinus]|uniref:Uncharacterized protein n=1 Tax=Pandoravirus salinus TaxID=1349410 RepID=S4VTZ3_9VIRU|nr:hypothetical protein psal_cds_254 [Pandoravirus salinus]AGO83813.1 hypothetical protein psal_cds_254 [Pandoravirus salinus]